MSPRRTTRLRRALRSTVVALLAVSAGTLLLPTAPAVSATATFGNGDSSTRIDGEVASTQLLGYECGTPTPSSDPDCNNYPLRLEVSDSFTTVYVLLTTDEVMAPDLDLLLYDAEGTLLGSAGSTGSSERAVIRIDRPITTTAVLVVQPFIATSGTPFTLDVRVKTSSAIPAPITPA